MTSPREHVDKSKEMVAVAIDKDKGSQAALKWACDHLLGKGKRVTLIHVKLKPSNVIYLLLCISFYAPPFLAVALHFAGRD